MTALIPRGNMILDPLSSVRTRSWTPQNFGDAADLDHIGFLGNWCGIKKAVDKRYAGIESDV